MIEDLIKHITNHPKITIMNHFYTRVNSKLIDLLLLETINKDPKQIYFIIGPR
jgi:hypothetical protein